MNINITYPEIKKIKRQRRDILNIVKWPFLFSSYICIIINIFTGAPAWSAIVAWSVWMIWSSIFSPDLIEFNRISVFIKIITDTCLLLILIDTLLAPGWAMEAVPLVNCGGLIVSGILFFTDLKTQKQNMFPMFLLIGVSIIIFILVCIMTNGKIGWPLIVMVAIAVALLIACITILKNDFIRELKKRFHVK